VLATLVILGCLVISVISANPAGAHTADGPTAVPIALHVTGDHLELVGPSPVLRWSNVSPGFTATLSISVRNDASTAAALSIGASGLPDQPGSGRLDLATLLLLRTVGGPAWQATVAQAKSGPSPTLLVVPAGSTGLLTLSLTLPGSVDNRAQGAGTGFALTFDTTVSTGAVSLPIETSVGPPAVHTATEPMVAGLAWTGVTPLAAILIGLGLLLAGGLLLAYARRSRNRAMSTK
jgi:hypothetical protein